VLVASAEFTLKSSPVRRTLEERLMDDLKVGLTRGGFDGFRIEKDAGRITILGISDAEAGARRCARIFGVAYAAPALVLQADMKSVLDTIGRLARRVLKPRQSFAIRAHRSTASPLNRRQIEIDGGSEVIRVLEGTGVKVNLTAPDMTFFVDLVGDHAYVYHERFSGPGGLPLSSQWKMLAVLDSGPLSILAAYAMMRRGCLLEPLIPLSNSVPAFSRGKQFQLANRLRELVTRSNYRAFTLELDHMLFGEGSDALSYFSAKRVVRLASMNLAVKKRFKGVVFSDVSGEVAELEIEFPNTNRINPPVFHPLIGLETEDLFAMCEEIGIPKEELLSQIELEGHGHPSAPFDFTKYLDGVEFEQVTI
jgi:thiamine biosynthesis protein ThiI